MSKTRDWRTVNRYRDKVVRCRATEKEHQQIAEDAARAGITMGAYLRKVLLDAPIPRQSRRPPVEVKQLALLLGDLGKIGSNLNQLARLGHAGLLPEPGALHEELEALRRVRSQIDQALNGQSTAP